MKTMTFVLAAALAFGLACSQEQAEDMADTAGEAAESAAESAEAVADKAAEAADEAMAEVTERVEDVDLASDPVARCTELAASESWAEALQPCTDAHAAQPDNMAIEHALQQAQAAAAAN